MATRRAWVLNLDADLELLAADGYTPRQSVRDAMVPHVEHLRATLLGPDDVLVSEGQRDGVARGLPGRAFCPTPRAVRLLRASGSIPEPHPDVAILRHVNDRAFAASLGPTLPHASFITSVEAAEELLARDPELGMGWRIKRRFGMAGRGQRVVPWGRGLADAERAFLRSGVAEGGVQIEPNVAIDAEYALHGQLAVDGALATGAIVTQRCDDRGAWLKTERVDPRHAPDAALALDEEVRRVAFALKQAGYFGPFGVDAYRYRDREGALRFQPRSEINARYSMGFAIGFGR